MLVLILMQSFILRVPLNIPQSKLGNSLADCLLKPRGINRVALAPHTSPETLDTVETGALTQSNGIEGNDVINLSVDDHFYLLAETWLASLRPARLKDVMCARAKMIEPTVNLSE